MEFNPIRHTLELVDAQGINAQLLDFPYSCSNGFDDRLREQLFKEYDYQEIMKRVASQCKPARVYMVTDSFECHYIFMNVPGQKDAQPSILIIGPYLSEDFDAVFQDVVSRNEFTMFQKAELKEYYRGVQHIFNQEAFESQIVILAKYIFDTEDYQVLREGIELDTASHEPQTQKNLADSLSVPLIEERYQDEDRLLDAVEHGDLKKAVMHLGVFQKYHLEPRVTDSLRNTKNILIVVNSLFRKAVQRSAVHPAHIDSLSSLFARRIEASRFTGELHKIMDEMLHKYCLLVQNHSLQGYSAPIQKVINHITFNYNEPIRLQALAKIAALSPSYLSMQFKKETNSSIVDYVNQKRIQRAQFLLATTDLSIQSISELVGFSDVNYFTRIFSKYIKRPPREYRKSLH